jgi:hypothetical protein
MKRFLLLLVVGAAAALAISYGLRLAHQAPSATVASLLPRETIAFVHVPDFVRSRDEFHRSDIYQIYTEPAVQDFLRKPLARFSSANSFSQTAQEIEQLDPKDAFMALTSLANDEPKYVGGFRFRGSKGQADKTIARWRGQFAGNSAPSETIDYEQHKIDIYTGQFGTLATAYDGNWFFAANDLARLKALLDRADGRAPTKVSLSVVPTAGQNQPSSLAADENFHAAMAQMPSNYALGIYVQPQVLAWFRGVTIKGTILEQMRSVYVTTRFDGGKLHDVIFVAMPKLDQTSELNRSSLALGTKDTFLYLASVLNLSKHLALLDPTGPGSALGAGLQKISGALAVAGITMDDWKAAFGSEAGALADWPQNAHWPSGVVTFPVQDAARAKKIVDVLARASDEDASWRETDRNGAHYWTMQSTAAGFLVFRPTIAVSNRVMVAGLDAGSVEAAIQRGETSASELANSGTYKNAARSLPAPESFFGYVDPALLYTRLDATLRPILLMGAAFMPAINEDVDLTKIPPAEAVTKHLSPIVSSQRYKDGGYLTESIGPITLSQTGIALLAGVIAAPTTHQMLPKAFQLPSTAPMPAPSGGWTGKGYKFSSSPSPNPSQTP